MVRPSISRSIPGGVGSPQNLLLGLSFPPGPGLQLSPTGHAAVHGGGLLGRYHVVVRHGEGGTRAQGSRKRWKSTKSESRSSNPRAANSGGRAASAPIDTSQARAAAARGITGQPPRASRRTAGLPPQPIRRGPAPPATPPLRSEKPRDPDGGGIYTRAVPGPRAKRRAARQVARAGGRKGAPGPFLSLALPPTSCALLLRWLQKP